MKNIVLGLMVALMAASVATSAYAGEGHGRGRGEGLFRKWFNFEKKWDNDDRKDRDDDKEHRKNKGSVFGTCGTDARKEMGEDMKAAFKVFIDAKKDAREDRTDAINSANGDQAKIVDAWEDYQSAFLSAWSAYAAAVQNAMKDYGTAFAKCKVALTPTPSSSVSPTPTPSSTPLPTYSMVTVQTHNTAGSCWAVVSGKVYNLTKWISKHPGGQSAIKALCGTDATAEFKAQHSGESKPESTLTKYLIGTL